MGVSMAAFPCLLFLLLLLLIIHSHGDGAEVVTIHVGKAKDLLHSGHVYLDVRTEEEFKKGHIHVDATKTKIFNIPYLFNTPEGRVKNPDFLKKVTSVCKKEDHLVVGCQSGVRSVGATHDLLKAGFMDVSNMGGGYLEWVQTGYPVKLHHEQEDDEL